MPVQGSPTPRILLPIIVAAAAGAFCASCFRESGTRGGAPIAQGGVIDLRAWNFDRDGSVPLVGAWDFFPGRLLYGAQALSAPREGTRNVPDLWKGADASGASGRGVGTYRLRVLLPPSLDDPTLRYTTVSTAFELDAGGSPLSRAGRPSADPVQALPAYRPDLVRLPRGEVLDLVMRVSNHEYRVGGMWRPFFLGTELAVGTVARSRQALSYAEAAALAAFALSYAAFFLHRRRQRSFLYLALLLASIALRALVTGEYVLTRILPGLGFEALIRLEYLTVFFPAPLALLFFASLFPLELPRGGVIALVLPFFALSLLLPLAPLPVLTSSVLLAYPLVLLAMLATGAFILVPAVVHKREDSVLELVGGTILMAAGANDMLFASFLARTGNFFPLSLLAFVAIQCYVLARRFAAALGAAEALSAEKDLLLGEIRHRVKNSLQIVSSAIALQEHRSENPAAAAALATARARIRAIGFVHEKLYSPDASGSMDLGAYLRDLAGRLEEGYRGDSGRVEVEVETEPIRAPQDLCVDVGLVLAELLSNAYRHARAGSVGARARVILRAEGAGLVLRVEDDGPGFPPGFDPEKSAGMGLKVVTGLARKRGGSLSLGEGPGASLELRMRYPEGSRGAGAVPTKETR